jgi:hypothetical protein
VSEPILSEAARLVGGERSGAYGPPEFHHRQTGRAWAALLSQFLKQDIPDLSPELVEMMFAADKGLRHANLPKRDNLVDIAGYAACAERSLAPAVIRENPYLAGQYIAKLNDGDGCPASKGVNRGS